MPHASPHLSVSVFFHPALANLKTPNNNPHGTPLKMHLHSPTCAIMGSQYGLKHKIFLLSLFLSSMALEQKTS